jgi:hypothetical protein
MKENSEDNKWPGEKPPEESYNHMRSAFAEVIRLAKVGAEFEVKKTKGKQQKDHASKVKLAAIAYAAAFINGVHDMYNQTEE